MRLIYMSICLYCINDTLVTPEAIYIIPMHACVHARAYVCMCVCVCPCIRVCVFLCVPVCHSAAQISTVVK